MFLLLLLLLALVVVVVVYAFLTHVLSYIAKVNLNWHRKAVVEVVIWFGSKRKFIS